MVHLTIGYDGREYNAPFYINVSGLVFWYYRCIYTNYQRYELQVTKVWGFKHNKYNILGNLSHPLCHKKGEMRGGLKTSKLYIFGKVFDITSILEKRTEPTQAHLTVISKILWWTQKLSSVSIYNFLILWAYFYAFEILCFWGKMKRKQLKIIDINEI